METTSRVLALDVTEIYQSARGQKVVNALLSSKGKLYHTKRGRIAVQIAPDIFARIKAQLKIALTDGLDGTQDVALIVEAAKVLPFPVPPVPGIWDTAAPLQVAA